MIDALNNKHITLTSQQLMAGLDKVVADIIRFNDAKKASDLGRLLAEKLEKKKSEVARSPEIYDFYKKIIVKLYFIALPLLDNSDIIDIFKNYFTWQFRLPDYDILAKLEAKLLTIIVIEERDEFKNSLRQTLLGNKEIITSKAEIKTIRDWLKNYNANTGAGTTDSLRKNQYLANLSNNKLLSGHDIKKLQTLINVYEMCKLSSFTPQGFEERVPIVIDGKLYIFNHGVLEQVKPSKQVERIMRATESSPSVNPIGEHLYTLQQLAEQYPQGSLERRAIEEEIAKNKKTVKYL